MICATVAYYTYRRNQLARAQHFIMALGVYHPYDRGVLDWLADIGNTGKRVRRGL